LYIQKLNSIHTPESIEVCQLIKEYHLPFCILSGLVYTVGHM